MQNMLDMCLHTLQLLWKNDFALEDAKTRMWIIKHLC